jgi:hypothetical protein
MALALVRVMLGRRYCALSGTLLCEQRQRLWHCAMAMPRLFKQPPFVP